MPRQRLVIAKPPRIAGMTTEQQVGELYNYLEQLYRAALRMAEALDAIGDVGEMLATVSNPPTQAEVAELRVKVNGVIAGGGSVEL